MTVHDLIPIFAANTCDQDTVRVFENFMRPALRHADHILSVSEYTARDIKRYVDMLQINLPPITVCTNGSSFAEFMSSHHAVGDLRPEELPERFVLFVATIEGRKNHQLMLDLWLRMIADGLDAPHLICVGRMGWKSSSFLSTLIETDYLDGRVTLLRDISDTDLSMLYDRCMFTVFPSFYEGWGLPVGESLALGKICVCSDRASIPEVAGDFGEYIDIDDFDASYEVLRRLIFDSQARTDKEEKIRTAYKPITWESVAGKVIAACLAAPEVKWKEPYPYTAIPYGVEISFAKLDRTIDGSGEPLLRRIEMGRKGFFLNAPLKAQNFELGEEARSSGTWSLPEDWGTWACHEGGELALGLGPSDAWLYYIYLRLRVSELLTDRPISIYANGELAWTGPIGEAPRVITFPVRRTRGNSSTWRLRIGGSVDLSPDLISRISLIDSRIPSIGFERMVVVPENELSTRLDLMQNLLFQ